jgi:hypothetical protein
MADKSIELSIKLTQIIKCKKLSAEDFEDFESNFSSPDFSVENEILITEGKAKISAEARSVNASNLKMLQASREVLIKCTFRKTKKVIELLQSDFVLDELNWNNVDIDKFMRYYIGDWEGIFINDEMIDFQSELLLALVE